MSNSVRRRITAAVVPFVLSAAVIGFAIEFAPNSIKRALVQNRTARHFIHAYHSLRKLPDIIFFPYWFRETALPVYAITIDEADIKTLESALPTDPIHGKLSEDNRVFVKAVFEADGYADEARVRYRGTNPNHWNARQRSWRINFPSENIYNGMSGLNLVIPQDRGYAIELLNMYRAEKFGLDAPRMHFARLKINDKDAGVYLAFENWSAEWLEKNGMPAEGNLLGVDDAHINFRNISIFTPEGSALWKSYTREAAAPSGRASPIEDRREFPEVETLIEILTHADDETFAALIPHIVDLQKTYAWSVVNILAKSTHQTDFNNSIFFFNTATGTFEPIPWDVSFGVNPPIAFVEMRTLEKRLFAIPRLRDARNALLASYINDEHNLADDLAFYDTITNKMQPEFFKDNEKLESNISYLLTMRELRKRIVQYFHDAKNVLEDTIPSETPAGTKSTSELALPPSFSTLPAVVKNKGAFIASHPQFYSIDATIIGIGPGTHAFRETIIIPAENTLVVQPGTRIFLDEGVSLLSYGPVIANGTTASPIVVENLRVEKPFGTFAVVNTEVSSHFDNVFMSGGAGDNINGIVFTGMLSLYNADGEITNSIFKNTYDDDAINFKYGTGIVRHSLFNNTFSDAIDFDYNDGFIESNTFLPPIGRGREEARGDAIDVSFSTVVIENNDIRGCGDKGISIGEKAHPLLKNNMIKNCPIGIAVKDQAHAEIDGGILESNTTGISLYQKKEIFGGATANITNVLFQNNKEDIIADHVSSYEIQ